MKKQATVPTAMMVVITIGVLTLMSSRRVFIFSVAWFEYSHLGLRQIGYL